MANAEKEADRLADMEHMVSVEILDNKFNVVKTIKQPGDINIDLATELATFLKNNEVRYKGGAKFTKYVSEITTPEEVERMAKSGKSASWHRLNRRDSFRIFYIDSVYYLSIYDRHLNRYRVFNLGDRKTRTTFIYPDKMKKAFEDGAANTDLKYSVMNVPREYWMEPYRSEWVSGYKSTHQTTPLK